MLTAYDYQIAKILDEVAIDMILVGDSLGMVVQGKPNTKTVTMEEMLYHTRAVAQGVNSTLIITDMPIHSYDNPKEALENAQQLLKAGAGAVKIEGNQPEVIQILIQHGVPVMGHVGLLPQTAEQFRVKGKKPQEAEHIWRDALELDKTGVFSIVLECMPEWLARKITNDVRTPTIGIGAGRYCDGQVLVTNDMLGFVEGYAPKFVKRFVNLEEIIKKAILEYIKEVHSGEFPNKKQTYH